MTVDLLIFFSMLYLRQFFLLCDDKNGILICIFYVSSRVNCRSSMSSVSISVGRMV